MATRTRWTLRIEQLRTRLAFDGAATPRPVDVSLTIHGLFRATPREPEDAMDLDALCAWITGTWSRTPATPMLETRVNQLLGHVFGLDPRVLEVRAAVWRVAPRGQASRVGVEREATRSQFTAQLRLQRA
ncbi:MAG: hypothetical protein U1E89_22795 [Burkholderiaceae bacterium]